MLYDHFGNTTKVQINSLSHVANGAYSAPTTSRAVAEFDEVAGILLFDIMHPNDAAVHVVMHIVDKRVYFRVM